MILYSNALILSVEMKERAIAEKKSNWDSFYPRGLLLQEAILFRRLERERKERILKGVK